MIDITIGESLVMSLLGMAVVFSVLVILMCVVAVMKLVSGRKNAAPAAAMAGAPAAAPQAMPASVALAPGSAGGVKTFDVPDQTAAMVMAIVADQTDTPLNELRFTSIRQVDKK